MKNDPCHERYRPLRNAALALCPQDPLADIAIAAHMMQLDLAVGLPDAGRWPCLVKHTEAMKVLPGFAANLAQSSEMLKGILPEKVALD